MGHVTNGTHSSQMEIPNGNFPVFFVNGKRPKSTYITTRTEHKLFSLQEGLTLEASPLLWIVV